MMMGEANNTLLGANDANNTSSQLIASDVHQSDLFLGRTEGGSPISPVIDMDLH